MNNKGFTLVELLAVILIFSIIGVIAYISVINSINVSKVRAEDKFLDDITKQIDSYLGLYGIEKFVKNGNIYSFDKNGTVVTVSEMQLDNGKEFTLQSLIDDLKMTDQFRNPRTEEICDAGKIKIEIYKDSDYVYYYYVDMTNEDIGCTALNDIDTRPDGLKCALGIDEAC